MIDYMEMNFNENILKTSLEKLKINDININQNYYWISWKDFIPYWLDKKFVKEWQEDIHSVEFRINLLSLWSILDNYIKEDNYNDYIKNFCQNYLSKNIREFLGYSSANKSVFWGIHQNELFNIQHKWITILWDFESWSASIKNFKFNNVSIVDWWQTSAIVLINFKILKKLINKEQLSQEEKFWLDIINNKNEDIYSDDFVNNFKKSLNKELKLKIITGANELFEREIVFNANIQNDTGKLLLKVKKAILFLPSKFLLDSWNNAITSSALSDVYIYGYDKLEPIDDINLIIWYWTKLTLDDKYYEQSIYEYNKSILKYSQIIDYLKTKYDDELVEWYMQDILNKKTKIWVNNHFAEKEFLNFLNENNFQVVEKNEKKVKINKLR